MFAESRPCPCGSGASYDGCCGPLIRREREAATAEELMRSRYSAFAVGDEDHLFRTWHPRTRPDPLTIEHTTRWTGLAIHDVVAGGVHDEEGEVAFTASYDGGSLTERSRFVRRRGRWVYVEAL